VIVGGSYDRSASDFRQSYQLGGFNADRSAAHTGAETEIVNLDGGSSTASLFATDTHSQGPRWHLTGSARYNVTRVRTVDRLSPPLPPPAAGLGGDLSFAKLNPAVGASYTPEARPASMPASARATARLRRSSWAARTRTVPATCRTP